MEQASSNPHYFFGIGLTSEATKWASNIQEALKSELDFERWTHPDDLHVTLKFLGGTAADELSELENRLDATDFGRSFSLDLGSVGYFGDPHRPRVLWLGMESSPALQVLRTKLEKMAFAAGVPVDPRPFRPHITLAKRWKGGEKAEALSAVLDSQPHGLYRMRVNGFHLYRIHPSKTPKYDRVKTYELRGDAMERESSD